MPKWSRVYLAAMSSGAVAFGGCTADPDVVVESSSAAATDAGEDEGGFGDVAPAAECVPGSYEGTVIGEWRLGDAGPGYDFKGPIVFSLERSLNGEFYEITNSEIRGASDSGVGVVQFSAQVGDGGGCREGSFSLPLDGDFPLGTTTVHFSGEVSGDYRKRTRVFDGEWNAVDSTGSLWGSGFWWAGLVTEDEKDE